MSKHNFDLYKETVLDHPSKNGMFNNRNRERLSQHNKDFQKILDAFRQHVIEQKSIDGNVPNQSDLKELMRLSQAQNHQDYHLLSEDMS